MFRWEACQLLQWIPIWQCVWLHMKNQSTCSYVLKMMQALTDAYDNVGMNENTSHQDCHRDKSTARTSWWALQSRRSFVSAQASSSYHWDGEWNCTTHGLGDSEWMKLIEKISEWLRRYQSDGDDIRVIEKIPEWSRRYQSDWEDVKVIENISG